MKKKLLISLSAMLALVATAFAWAEGVTPGSWWASHKAVLGLAPGTVTSTSITPAQYLEIKTAISEYDALDPEDQFKVQDIAEKEDGTAIERLDRQIVRLKSANTNAATTVVSDLCTYVKNLAKQADETIDLTKVPASQIDELNGKLALLSATDGWGQIGIVADFTTLNTNLAAYTTKVQNAINNALVNKYIDAASSLIAATNKDVTTLSAIAILLADFENAEKYPFISTSELTTIKGRASETTSALQGKQTELQQQKDLNFLTIVVPHMMSKLGVYEFVDADLADAGEVDFDNLGASTDYSKLTGIKTALYTLRTDISDDNLATATAGADLNVGTTVVPKSFIESAIFMAGEQLKMEAARTYLNNADNLYTKAKQGSAASVTWEDYAKIQPVYSSTLASQNDYVKSLYTADMAKVIYDKAVPAMKAHEIEVFAGEAKTAFETEYETVLAEEYVATAADYETGTNTVRDAINAYKALYAEGETETTTSWEVATNFKNTLETWAITDAEKLEIGRQAKELLAADYATLQTLVRTAAVLKLQAILDTEANGIYDAAYVDPTDAGYDAEAVLKLKNDLATIKTAVTNFTNLGTAKAVGTKMQYYYWNAETDKYVENTNSKDKAYAATTGADKTFGSAEVYNPYKAKTFGNATDNYYARKAKLTAMQQAAQFLSDKAALIWTGEPETLNTAGAGLIGLDDLATTTLSKTTGSYSKLSAAAKAYIPANNPVGEATVGSAEQVYDVLVANCAVALGETLPSAGISKIEICGGNTTKVLKTITSPVVTSVEEVNKLIADELENIAKTDADGYKLNNHLVYVYGELDPAKLDDNIVVKNGSNWVANCVTFESGYPWYIKYAISNVSTIKFSKRFNHTKHMAIYLPFAIDGDDFDNLIAEDGLGFKVRSFVNVLEGENENGDIVAEVIYKSKKLGDQMFANMPYILNAPNTGRFTIESHNKQLAVTGTAAGSVTAQSVYSKYTLTGTLKDATVAPGDNQYRLDNTGYWQPAKEGNNAVYANSAILKIVGNSGVNYIIKHRDSDEGETTGIDNISTVSKPVEGIYTINGQKVENMNKPGLYIVNGKKVMVK